MQENNFILANDIILLLRAIPSLYASSGDYENIKIRKKISDQDNAFIEIFNSGSKIINPLLGAVIEDYFNAKGFTFKMSQKNCEIVEFFQKDGERGHNPQAEAEAVELNKGYNHSATMVSLFRDYIANNPPKEELLIGIN